MRAPLYLLALTILLVVMLASRQTHRPLDPDEPIAADGSLAAGRALTIFDFEPVLGAFDPPYPLSDSDDPKNFEDASHLKKPGPTAAAKTLQSCSARSMRHRARMPTASA